MKTIKCDKCHKKRKLYFYQNKVDTGYVAYCKNCAVDMGYYNDSKVLRGSAIRNAKQHSRHDRINHHRQNLQNEGRNEEMRGMTAPALQLYEVKKYEM